MITFEAYFDRLVALHVQFNTARKAMDGFVKNSGTLEQYAAEDFAEMRGILTEAAKKQNISPESTWLYDNEAINKYLEGTKSHTIKMLTDAQQRLRQYEFILHVTILEDLMKEVHRELLTANPSLLREDRQIPLGRLVAKGGADVIREEIEREVQALDRESTKKKAEYFFERLGINWLPGVDVLHIAIRLRNEMLHENPDRTVNELEYAIMQAASMFVPFLVIAQAALLYPKVCQLPLNMTEDDVGKLFAGG
jgi:hypothetical protein